MSKINIFFRKLNFVFIIFLVCISVFISACGNTSSPNAPEIVTGTSGLVIDTLRGSEVSELYEGDNYYMQLELSNEGATDIEDATLIVASIDNMFNILNKDDFKTFSLRGDDGTFHGEKKISEIQLQAKQLRADQTQTDSKIFVKACYEYETFFQSSFCIDTDVRGTQVNKVCEVSPISGSKGQGAPVIVQSVEPKISIGESGARVSFEIIIGARGNGDVLAVGTAENVCNNGARENILDKITVSEIVLSSYTLSSGSIECESHTSLPNVYDLSSNIRDSMRCHIVDEIPYDRGTFMSPIMITLNYGYEDSLVRTVTIEKAR